MSDTPISSESVSESMNSEIAAGAALGAEFMDLSEEQKLDLVLFPETHTSEVEILGKKRELKVLTLKFAKKIFKELEDHAKNISAAIAAKDVEMGPDVISGLEKASRTIAEFYKWDDVLQALNDEALSLTEMQILCNSQQHLQGANDFLLGPLRAVIRVCQSFELANKQFLALPSMLRLQNRGAAPSTS